MENPSFYRNAFYLSLCMFALLIFTSATTDSHWQPKVHKLRQNWINHGGDIHNRRFAANETKLSPETASKLKLKWKFFAGNDITATPAIFEGTLYFPSWNGYLYAVKASNGALVWKKKLQKLTGLKPSVLGRGTDFNSTLSRSTPTVAGDILIIGIYGPAVVIAVERLTGKLVWSTKLDQHPAGVITMSGTPYKGGFYVGTSSLEETFSVEDCCTFRGSFSKLDIISSKIIWQTYMLPANHLKLGEYAGASVWGSSPAIDSHRNLAFIATGNLYSAPKHVQECQEKENNQTIPSHPDECIEPDNHSESFLALDLDTGKIKWYHQVGGYDVWFLACNNLSVPNCPVGPNPDADFGEAPMMVTVYINGTKQDLVVAAQKSGFVWALSRDNGNIVWTTEAGPGGILGGGTWGAATDNKRIYTNIANSDGKNFTLKPSNKNTTAGGWVGLASKNGEILWAIADPSNGTTAGPVTVANGVVFGGSTHPTGPIYAINARTGKILWSYKTGATVYGGMSVSNGCIYVGHGHRSAPPSTAGTSLFAFCVS